MDTPLRLVLFDFDGTLCDSAATIIRLMQQACSDCGLPIPDSQKIRGNIGHGVNHSALDYVGDDREKAAALADCYRALSRAEYLSGNPPLDPLFDGVASVLQALSEAGYLTGIITNKSRTGLKSLIERHGLEALLDISLTADDCMVKPAPDMALEAMRQLGVDTENTLLVGDTEIDAGCAANAGIGFVGVSWGYHSPDLLRNGGAMAILESYAELPFLIQQYFSPSS
jgi:phosphoglycolate phosphatase